MSILSSIGKIATGALNTLTVSFVHPIQTAVAVVSPKSTVKGVIEEHFAQPLSKQLGETAIATGTYVAATLAVGTSAGKAIVVKAASSLIPKTVIGKVVGAVGLSFAAPVISGIVVAHPEQTAKIIENTPSAFIQAQKDIYKLAKEPSIEEGLQFLRNHPYLTITTAAVALGAMGFVGIKLAQVLATHFNTKAINENNETGNNNIVIVDKRGKDEELTANPMITTTPQAINIYTAPAPVAVPAAPVAAPVAAPAAPVAAPAAPGKKKKKVVKKKKKVVKKKKKVVKKKKKVVKKKKKTIKRKKHK